MRFLRAAVAFGVVAGAFLSWLGWQRLKAKIKMETDWWL